MLQLILIAHGVIFRLKMIPFFLQCNQVLAALIQRLDGLTDIFGAQLIDGAAIIHGTAIGLGINLQMVRPKVDLPQPDSPTRPRSRPRKSQGRCHHWPSHTSRAFQREPLLQIADAEQNFLSFDILFSLLLIRVIASDVVFFGQMGHGRLGLVALFGGVFAAGCKFAALGQIQRVRDRAGDRFKPFVAGVSRRGMESIRPSV